MWEVYKRRITGITIWRKRDQYGGTSYAATNNRGGVCREPLGCNVYTTAQAAEWALKAEAELMA